MAAEPRANTAVRAPVRTSQPAPHRAGDGWAIATLLAFTALVAWNRLAFDAWLSRMDLMTFFLPWYHLLGERLRDLDVPAWNPHLFSGAPFAGDPESGWMYLPAMLFFSLFSTATTAFKGMVVAQLLTAALSTYAFARVLGMGAMASLVAATAYLVGPFLHWNTHCCLIFSQFATWIPLALLGAELALRATNWKERIAPWFLGGFAVSQMFAGWIGEGWLYAVLLPGAYIGYRALLSPPHPGIDWRERVTSFLVTGTAVIGLGMALAAAGMLPRYAVNAETNLAGGDYSRLGESGILNPPWSLDYLLTQTLGTGAGYHFRAAAFGGAVVVLALLALPLARQRFAVPFFLTLTLVAMILTLDTTPLHYLFYLIPRFREFHDHDAWRTMALAAIGPAMLSGAAIDSLSRWRGKRRMLTVVLLPLAFLALVAVALRGSGLTLGWQALFAAAITTALVALVIATPPDRGRPTWVGDFASIVPALVLLVIVLIPTGLELGGSWLGLPREGTLWRHLHRDAGISRALASEVSGADPGGAGEFLQEQLAASGPFRYVGYGGFGYPAAESRINYMEHRLDPRVQAFLANGRPIYLGLYDIQGYNPLQLSRYVEFMTALNGVAQDYHTEFLMPSGVHSTLLDLLDVRYVLVDADLPRNRSDVRAMAQGRGRVFRTPWVIVYADPTPPPHAWIVHDVREVARGEALPPLINGAIDPYQTALVEGPPPATAASADPAAESAVVTSYGHDGLTVDTSSGSDGLLVVSEIYADGWRAFVDGAEAPVLPTHHALLGVPLPAGEHTVELRYDPLALRIGLWISGIATVAMLLAFAWAGWRFLARRDPSPSALIPLPSLPLPRGGVSQSAG